MKMPTMMRSVCRNCVATCIMRPRPEGAAISSEATSVAHDEPSATRMPTKMLRAEDLAAMTGSALVAHYNQLVEENPELGYKKTERFASAAKGLYRIEAL